MNPAPLRRERRRLSAAPARVRLVPVRLVPMLCCLVLAGCGLTRTANQPPPSPSFSPRPTAVTASTGADGVQRVSIGAKNSRFVPPTVTAHPGALVITFHNDEAAVHNLSVFTTPQEELAGAAGSDLVSTGTVKGHQTVVLTVTIDQPGTYRFFCRFHRAEGMFGSLRIQ